MSLIEVKDLKYRYPGTTELALDGVSFTVEKGEFIGIAGENGTGKSSLSQALLGLIPQFYKGAYGGSVTVCGMDARSTPVSELCRHVGLVFQNPFNQLSGAKDTVYRTSASRRRRSAPASSPCSAASASGSTANGIRSTCPAVSFSAWPSALCLR